MTRSQLFGRFFHRSTQTGRWSLASFTSRATPARARGRLRDLWAKKEIPFDNGLIEGKVKVHDVVMVRVTAVD